MSEPLGRVLSIWSGESYHHLRYCPWKETASTEDTFSVRGAMLAASNLALRMFSLPSASTLSLTWLSLSLSAQSLDFPSQATSRRELLQSPLFFLHSFWAEASFSMDLATSKLDFHF